MEAIADLIDGVIYHYASAEGLREIIENSEIWLTNVIRTFMRLRYVHKF